MHRERKRRRLIIVSLLVTLILMVTSYAAFQSKLDIKGSTKVTSNWDVRITNVTNGTPEGNAENSKDENDNVILPTYDGLSASMSADLYEVGDSMEYVVTITNRGNLDATLDEVTKVDSSNSAVIITYSGYAEGQKLYKGTSINIKVKIAYNPEYSGGEVTGTSSLTFSFKEADVKDVIHDNVISQDDRTLTYNCGENGGEEANQNSVFDIGSSVDLGVQCHKEGYTFLGWNTDKNATTVLNSYTMPNSDTTLYGIYQKTINITYTKDDGVKTISKNSDTCTIYNKTSSCAFTLPTLTLDNDTDNTYYELNGWYIEDVFAGNSNESHTYTDSVTVEATTTALPVMMSGQNFQNKIASVKSSVTAIEFVDLNNTNLGIPTTIDNTTSWDVSAKQNGSVISWLDETKMYIGAKGGVIGNNNLSWLFNNFFNVMLIEFNDNFDTSKATNMLGMFMGCFEIEYLDLSSFNTTKVMVMDGMFNMWVSGGTANSKLKSVNLSSFDTRRVNDMHNMFYDCNSLTELDLSNFDTSEVTAMQYMFYGCSDLTELNISNFDTSLVENMYGMFVSCSSLTTIYVSGNFVTTSVTNSTSMFTNDTNLVGGNGTKVSDKKVYDGTYALIDKEGQEGYFTDGTLPIIRNVSNVRTTKSITVTVDAWVPNGDDISKIEYSIDGVNYYEQTDNNIADNVYTFDNLTHNTNYTVYVRVTSEKNKVKIGSYEYMTNALQTPTYTEEEEGKEVTVTVSYPDGCGSTYSCYYTKDSNSEVEVNSNSVDVEFTTDGNITARVSDGDNVVSSSYNAMVADTLYKVVRRDAVKDTIASTYDGNGSASFDNTVYYYNSTSDATRSNVLFNGICWQMVRTTDTGGVKLLYNGEADSNNQCGTDRPNHEGTSNDLKYNLTTSYKYGSSYTLSNGTFTLTDLYTYDGSNPNDLIGKYTCLTNGTTCTTLHYVDDYEDGSSFWVILLNTSTIYSSIGKIQFNQNAGSLAYAGYMYNSEYLIESPEVSENISSAYLYYLLNTTRYYGDGVEWNTSVANKYSLNNPFTISSSSDYSNLVGKYLVSDGINGTTNTNTSGTYAFYVLSVDGTSAYAIRLSNGETINDYEKYYTFGKNVADNGDGTYTISGSLKTIKRTEWGTNYTNVATGDYVCFGQNNTCTEVYQITAVGRDYFKYRQIDTYVYGNDVEYNPDNSEGEKYVLTGKGEPFIDWKANYNTINNTHYTCFNSTGKCDEVYFIYYTDNFIPYYIKLTEGKTVEDALEDMLSASDVNEKNSTIKSAIDLWYKENMKNKTSELEDTVYCNDRSINSLGGWSKTGNTSGGASAYLSFRGYIEHSDLVCPNNVDSFTVSSDNGNGALEYPTGLLSNPESFLLGVNAKISKSNFWIDSPRKFGGNTYGYLPYYAQGMGISSDGKSTYNSVTNVDYPYSSARPVVSLKSNTPYASGSGTYTSPYVIE